jgi:hypothetical protein
MLGMTVVAGKTECLKCGSEWGSIIKYAGVFLPTIKAEQFIIQSMNMQTNVETERVNKRRWKLIEDTYFVVDPITDSDLV